MAHLSPLPNPPKPLPLAPGPKLAPFTRTAHATIQFVEELGNPDRDQDGRVWKVRIGGKQQYYALKMFSFSSTEYLKSDLSAGLLQDLTSPQLYNDFFDPLSCECRAYGRLKQEGREDLAIQAHGYLLLSPQQEAEVDRRTKGTKHPSASDNKELDGDNPWGRYEEHRHLPVRAVVKELVNHQDPFTRDQIPRIWRDLEDLHRLGILVRDINVFNYIGGKLIDFSRAWTTPHPFPSAIHPYYVQKALQGDPLDLNTAFIEWGTEKDWNWDIIPGSLLECASGKGRNGRYGINPSQYNWQKWEKDPAAVETIMTQQIFVSAEDVDHEKK